MVKKLKIACLIMAVVAVIFFVIGLINRNNENKEPENNNSNTSFVLDQSTETSKAPAEESYETSGEESPTEESLG